MAQKHHRMSLKWLRPFFDLPAQPAKSLFFVKISKWPNLVNFHPIWFKLGMEVIYDPLNGKLPLKVPLNVAAAIFFTFWLKRLKSTDWQKFSTKVFFIRF